MQTRRTRGAVDCVCVCLTDPFFVEPAYQVSVLSATRLLNLPSSFDCNKKPKQPDRKISPQRSQAKVVRVLVEVCGWSTIPAVEVGQA